MTTYEFQGQRLRRPDEDDLERGDTYEADGDDDPYLRAFGDLFVEAEDSGSDGESESAEDSDDDVDQLLSGTVDEVEDDLDSGEYDDRLDEIEERADRQGVLDAVEERRD